MQYLLFQRHQAEYFGQLCNQHGLECNQVLVQYLITFKDLITGPGLLQSTAFLFTLCFCPRQLLANLMKLLCSCLLLATDDL